MTGNDILGYSDTLVRELAGWSEDILANKISNLASVIMRMNDSQGPDLLGVCEVENRRVLSQLVQAIDLPERNYEVVHHNSSDKRGIDVAFVYDANRLRVNPSEIFHHIIQKRTATRDLLQVNFYTKPQDNLLICIGNHWPSRAGGVLESAPYRMLAGETLSYWMKRIHEIYAERDLDEGKVDRLSQALPPPVLVMGDFNDEPFDRSMTDYALALRDERRVRSRRSRNPYLLNLMWPLMGSGHFTHEYNGSPNMIDQFLVNRGMLDSESTIKLARISMTGKQLPFVGIVKFIDMVSDRGVRKDAPRRFGRPSKYFDPEGFSDHFPIAIKLLENSAVT